MGEERETDPAIDNQFASGRLAHLITGRGQQSVGRHHKGRGDHRCDRQGDQPAQRHQNLPHHLPPPMRPLTFPQSAAPRQCENALSLIHRDG